MLPTILGSISKVNIGSVPVLYTMISRAFGRVATVCINLI